MTIPRARRTPLPRRRTQARPLPDRPADREIAEAALAASVAGDDVDWRVRLLRARLRTTRATRMRSKARVRRPTTRSRPSVRTSSAGRSRTHGRSAASCTRARPARPRGRRPPGAADNAAAAAAPRRNGRAPRRRGALLDGPESVAEAEARCRLVPIDGSSAHSPSMTSGPSLRSSCSPRRRR